MKCDFCDEKATVFLTQLVGEEMKKMCLCEPCAVERGVTDPLGLSLGSDQMAQMSLPETANSSMDDECPTCGFTLGHLRKIGRLGCAECYGAFGSEVHQMIGGMHKGTKHLGRVPEGLVAQNEVRQRLAELRERLDSAVASEEFETAAEVKKKIDELQAETVQS